MPYVRGACCLTLLLLAVITVVNAEDALAQPEMPKVDARVCKLLPMAELEAHYASKAPRVSGSDDSVLSVCTANFGSFIVRLESGPHDPVQLPPNVSTALMGVKAMLGNSKQLQFLDTHDFGRIGCYRTKVSFGGDTTHSTVCVMMPDGWYLNFMMTHADPQRVSYEVVKLMIEKIAARRK